MALPRPLADPLWHLTQRRHFLWSRDPFAEPPAPVVAVLEPTWDNNAHLPGNLGLLRILRLAYPRAELHFAGGAAQIGLLKSLAPTDLPTVVGFTAWRPQQDTDTLPADLLRTTGRLLALPSRMTFGATRIVLSSCTANMLSALILAGLAKRTCAYLHGNANEIFEWNSRNPLRAHLQFGPVLRRFVGAGGQVIVLEERIRVQLGEKFPWLAPALHCIAHPLLPEEATSPGAGKSLALPLEIGFAGLATRAKGFPEFLQLARELTTARPGAFRFNAFGKLAPECRDLDQSSLIRRADQGLARQDFIDGLRRQHFLFVWHQDNYYGNAASGVVYDAINLGIPLIAHDSSQIRAWRHEGFEIGMAFKSITDTTARLATFDPAAAAADHAGYQVALARLRQSLGLPVLARVFASTFPLKLATHGRLASA